MTASKFFICAMLLLFAPGLSAEEASDKHLPGLWGLPEEASDKHLPGLWGLRLVAFGQNFPAYPSSSDQNLTILPIPYPVYRGRILRFGEDLEDIANSKILDTNRVHISIGLSASFPESSNDLSGREGMPDLGFLIEAGPKVDLYLSGDPDDEQELSLSLQLRGAVSLDGLNATGRGFVFSPDLEYLTRGVFDSETELRFRISPAWATSNYTNFFYGVDPEFATPSRPSFDAESGYLNTEFLVGLNRKITDRLEFRGSIRFWVNKGSANSASPLYQRDYDHGIRLAIFWTAWESKRRIATKD